MKEEVSQGRQRRKRKRNSVVTETFALCVCEDDGMRKEGRPDERAVCQEVQKVADKGLSSPISHLGLRGGLGDVGGGGRSYNNQKIREQMDTKWYNRVEKVDTMTRTDRPSVRSFIHRTPRNFHLLGWWVVVKYQRATEYCPENRPQIDIFHLEQLLSRIQSESDRHKGFTDRRCRWLDGWSDR